MRKFLLTTASALICITNAAWAQTIAMHGRDVHPGMAVAGDASSISRSAVAYITQAGDAGAAQAGLSQVGSGGEAARARVAAASAGTAPHRTGSGRSAESTVRLDQPVDQPGDGNQASIAQGGESTTGTVAIHQPGQGNTALISQNGSLLQAEIVQGGLQNHASVAQSGLNNFASVSQGGSSNVALVTQGPILGARAVVVQNGTAGVAVVRQ